MSLPNITSKESSYSLSYIINLIEKCIEDKSYEAKFWTDTGIAMYRAQDNLEQAIKLYQDHGWNIDLSEWEDFDYPGVTGSARIFNIKLR